MMLRTPPMGFNTWNGFGPDIDEGLLRELADAMLAQGLKDAGYTYLVIDDCWSQRQRDPVTDEIVPDRQKFPNGLRAVSDFIHEKGLKFGLYSCAGVRTCANFPGSFGHEFRDARTFASYGCDYLKYDYCNVPHTHDGPLLYRKMGLALRACGRDIVFSLCNWGMDETGRWARSAGGDLYRSTGDIFDNFVRVREIAMSQVENFCYSAPGCFNDMDMLTVGMKARGNAEIVKDGGGCTDAEYRTQFALWCLFGAPLMLGCDIRNMDAQTKALVTNKTLLAIDQDVEVRGVVNVSEEREDKPAFFRLLSGGKAAIGLFNFTEEAGEVWLPTYNVGLPDGCGFGFTLRDVFTGEVFEKRRDYIGFEIPSHDCRVFLCDLVPLD